MNNEDKFVLRFSHKIVEHLGIKLYQNKPTNVIAELISNSWDAESKNVWIKITGEDDKKVLIVMDDGHGMSTEIIRKNYLVIGKPKRAKNTPNETTPTMQRFLMGRKGIGKLAPFGIAGTINLISVSLSEDNEQVVTWLRLDVVKMRELEDKDEEVSSFEPEVFCSNASIADFIKVAEERKHLDKANEFLEKIGANGGTIIVMSDLSTKRAIDPAAIKESIGRRFTVTLLRDDFKVHVNSERVTEKEALPEFAFMVGKPSSLNVESIQLGEKELKVSYWVGFVGTAQWPQDQAGVGVYAHGKVAQDRPFTFGHKGGEIFSRYMYAVVEADWLDELPEDLASTDRTTVDWEHPFAAVLKTWGEQKVRDWISQYKKFRGSEDRKKNVDRIRNTKNYHLSDTETEAIADLLTELSPSIGNDDDARDRAIDSLAGAWIHQPMREMTKKLWDALKGDDSSAQHFIQTIDRLREHLVPESLSLAVTFSQRVYALTLLHKRIHDGTETDLQKLIETFPWILQPEMEKLTANQQLKTVIEEAEAKGAISVAQIDASPAATLKPDFVFFSPPGEYDKITVVELKNPGHEHHLTRQNELQLVTYMAYIQTRYPKATLEGFLVGNNNLEMTSNHKNIQVLDWSDVLNRSRKGHIELLASMLVGANPDPNDTRVAQVAEYGGKETKELLERLAANDSDLKALIQKFE